MSNLTGRIVMVTQHNTPGAWDNYALPEHYYRATYLDESGKIQTQEVPAGTVPDASPELIAQYDAIMAEGRARAEAKRLEEERNTPRVGKVMEVLKGKNRGFSGTVKWVGESKYGPSALLIDEAGRKVFTKPTNLTLIKEAPPPVVIEPGMVVEVKMGPNAGKVGTVVWVGQTRYGYRARVEVKGQSKDVWTSEKNLEPKEAA